MAITISNTNKNTDTTIINQDKTGTEVAWDEADVAWDEMGGTWDNPGKPVITQAKNNLTITNQTKN